MKNLRPFVILSVTLFASTFVAGCGGRGKIASANTTPPPPGATAAGPSGSPAPSPTPGDPAPSPTPSPSPSTPSNSTTIADIQKLDGWQGCTGGCTSTPAAVYSMSEGIQSPSLSGSSATFRLLAGTQPYGGALWFKYVGNIDNATHFVYDLFFYVDNPSASQALEFNVSQSAKGSRYNFSTQCQLAGANVWRVWDPMAHAWAASSATCFPPAANSWNHLVWEFERDAGGNVIFSAVTLNDNRQAVNLTMPHVDDNQTGVDVSFQPDADVNGTPYSVWLDKVSLAYW